ncbi:transposable element Tcb2 transposase [Trichonephila clavipes]|nr:transposable element Tcb2 transposase [Trichonephila clavipes]
MLLPEVESLRSWRKAAVGQVWLQSSELLTASFHDFGDNFKLQEQLSGGSVVVVHEEPHPQMTGTLSYRPEETGGETAGEIARHTTQATGRPISRFTVAKRLHGGGLFARCPVRRVPLTPAHLRRRSLWCREHRNWRDNEWGRVLFTDESRFSLSSDSHRILIWREREAAIIPRTSLKGTVNGTRYCNEILLPYVRLFRGAMGLQFLFMEDNAPCHRTVVAEQLLESEDIERMDWPARSPDLNPIEHVWDFLGRRLAARTLPPVTIRELRLALQDEWAAMPQQLIDTLLLSMGRRCETCLAVREIISPTKDRIFLAGHPSQGCFGLQSHCAPCYFFNQASFYPSDFSFSKRCLHYTCPYVLGILRY